MREWYGAFPHWGPLSEHSATKLKRGRLSCVLCMCIVYGVLFSPLWLFPPVDEICARLAGNFCQ
jgi:hypothetical protein